MSPSALAASTPVLFLAHDSEVRITGSLPHHNIRVRTSIGCGYGPAPAGEEVWGSRAAGVLDNSPKDVKLKAMAARKAAFDAAPELSKGDLVCVDGRVYIVGIHGAGYADPIAFRPV